MRRPRASPSSTRSSKTRWSSCEAASPRSSTGPEAAQPGGEGGVAQVSRQQRAGGVGVPLPGVGRVTRGDGLGGRATGGQPGGDGVEDALAGERVDQAGGVADQQGAAVGRAPAGLREREVVTDPVGRVGRGAGQQLLESLDQLGAGGPDPPGGERLAVPDVGEAVAAVEAPGVRRLPDRAERDDLGPGASGGHGRVAADRQCHRAGSVAERASYERVGAVGADHDRSVERSFVAPVDAGRCHRPHPVVEQGRAGVLGGRDQTGVEDRARHDVRRSGHLAVDAARAAHQPQPGDRRPVVEQAGDADARRAGRARAGRRRRRRTCRGGRWRGRRA